MVISQLAKLSTSLWLQLLLKPTMEPSTRNRASLTSRLPPRSNTITTPSLNWSHPYYQNRSTGPPRRSNSIHQNARFALKTKHYISTNWTWRVRCRKLILIFRFFLLNSQFSEPKRNWVTTNLCCWTMAFFILENSPLATSCFPF